MRITIIVLLFFMTQAGLIGQNVLGSSEKEVKTFFRNNKPDLVLDSNFKNDHYSYLKFVDSNSNLVTILVFMSKRERCTGVRAIYDLSIEDSVREDLNSKYRKIELNKWIDDTKGKKALVEFIKGDWYITVNISPAK